MLMTHRGVQAAGIEQAGMPRDLELAVNEKATAGHHALTDSESLEDWNNVVASRPSEYFARLECAASFFNIDDAPRSTVQNGCGGNDEQAVRWACIRRGFFEFHAAIGTVARLIVGFLTLTPHWTEIARRRHFHGHQLHLANWAPTGLAINLFTFALHGTVELRAAHGGRGVGDWRDNFWDLFQRHSAEWA
jgi:hypothetical protein